MATDLLLYVFRRSIPNFVARDNAVAHTLVWILRGEWRQEAAERASRDVSAPNSADANADDPLMQSGPPAPRDEGPNLQGMLVVAREATRCVRRSQEPRPNGPWRLSEVRRAGADSGTDGDDQSGDEAFSPHRAADYLEPAVPSPTTPPNLFQPGPRGPVAVAELRVHAGLQHYSPVPLPYGMRVITVWAGEHGALHFSLDGRMFVTEVDAGLGIMRGDQVLEVAPWVCDPERRGGDPIAPEMGRGLEPLKDHRCHTFAQRGQAARSLLPLPGHPHNVRLWRPFDEVGEGWNVQKLSVLRNLVLATTRARVARLAAKEAVNHCETHVLTMISGVHEVCERDQGGGTRAATAADTTVDFVLRRAMDLITSRKSLLAKVGHTGWRVRRPGHCGHTALMLVWYEFCAGLDLTKPIPKYEEDLCGSERALAPLMRLRDAIRAEIMERVAQRANARRFGVFALCASCEVTLGSGETRLISVSLPRRMSGPLLIIDREHPGFTVCSMNDGPALQVRGAITCLERELVQPPTVDRGGEQTIRLPEDGGAAPTIVLKVTNRLPTPQTIGTRRALAIAHVAGGTMLPPAVVDFVGNWAGPWVSRQRPGIRTEPELWEAMAAAASGGFMLHLEYNPAGLTEDFSHTGGLVTSVVPNSRAWQAGLLPGDFILTVGGANFREELGRLRSRLLHSVGRAARPEEVTRHVFDRATRILCGGTPPGTVGLTVRRCAAPAQPLVAERRLDAGTAAMNPVDTYHGANGRLRLGGEFAFTLMGALWGCLVYDPHGSSPDSNHERYLARRGTSIGPSARYRVEVGVERTNALNPVHVQGCPLCPAGIRVTCPAHGKHVRCIACDKADHPGWPLACGCDTASEHVGPRIVLRDDRGQHTTLCMGPLATLHGPWFAAFFEAVLAPLLNLPRDCEGHTLRRMREDAHASATGTPRRAGYSQGSFRPYSHYGNVLYRVEPRGAVTRVTASCSGIRVGEPVDTLLYYAVAPQPARPCSSFPACVRPSTPNGTLRLPCAMCQFHLRTAPETWLACGACAPGRLGELDGYTPAAPAAPAGTAGPDFDSTGPLLTPAFLEQLHRSQPSEARCHATIEPALIAARESLVGLARIRRGLVLGRGQRPPGCITLITAEMDAILAGRHGCCDHQECLDAREYFSAFRPGATRPDLRGLPFNINDFIPCTRVQAACQGFVARAAQWAQHDHQNREGYWAAGTSGHPWAFAERQFIVAEHGVVGRSAVPNYPTTPQTPSGP